MKSIGIALGAAAMITMLYGAFRLGNLGTFDGNAIPAPDRLHSGLADGNLSTTTLTTPGEEIKSKAPVEAVTEAEPGADSSPLVDRVNQLSEVMTDDLKPQIDTAATPADFIPESPATEVTIQVPSEQVNLPGVASRQPVIGRDEQSAPPLQRQFWAAATTEEIQEVLVRCSRQTYIVKPNDHFIGVISEFTGRQDAIILDEMESMNPHIRDYNHIEPGWVLYLPDFGS